MSIRSAMNRRGRPLAVVLLAVLVAGTAVAAGAAKKADAAPKAAKDTKAAPATAEPPAPHAGNPHGDMSLDCRLCHNAQGTANDKALSFDHATTGFVLEGQHARVACRDCHRQPQFSNIGTRCSDCHQDAHQARLGPVCEQCHTPDGWVQRTRAQRDHDNTRLPLVGAHAKVDCDACHEGAVRGTYVGTPFECYACHQADFEATSNPNHRTAGFTTDCNRCHGVFSSSWGRGDFIHSLNFPLTGAHATAQCAACHTDRFAGTPTDCYACHQPAYDSSVNPPHAAANLGTDCVTCHTTAAWRPTSYNHATTGFALTGGHSQVACMACHQSGYVGTPADCYSCHRTNYEGTTNPNHVAGVFPTDCTICHTATRWDQSNFDHARTTFPLTGAHASRTCVECHATGYTGTPTDCYACHRTNYEATANPNHAAANIPTTCATCHSTTGWTPASFNHNATSFPLTGAHTAQTCTACHATAYTGTPSDCYACHQANYTGATNPEHAAAGYPTACVTCHSTAAWSPAQFNHNSTSFPLTGAHTAQACVACHATTFNGTPTDCYACHQANYTGATNPEHAAAGYPTACATCHSTTGWSPAQFNHNTTTFPLTGAHTAQACAACHATTFNGTPTDCYACHQNDYTRAANPEHAAAGYPTACVTCHSTTAWSPAQFNHSTTSFPLTGAHTTQACAACHATTFNGTPTDCYACHQSAYAQTTNPSHAAASFPTTCTTCHTTTAWAPSTWNHETLFPIKTGKHTNLSCTQCHVTPSNYANFECILCHEHNQADMNSKHSGRAGYSWVSSECYRCHPRGRT